MRFLILSLLLVSGVLQASNEQSIESPLFREYRQFMTERLAILSLDYSQGTYKEEPQALGEYVAEVESGSLVAQWNGRHDRYAGGLRLARDILNVKNEVTTVIGDNTVVSNSESKRRILRARLSAGVDLGFAKYNAQATSNWAKRTFTALVTQTDEARFYQVDHFLYIPVADYIIAFAKLQGARIREGNLRYTLDDKQSISLLYEKGPWSYGASVEHQDSSKYDEANRDAQVFTMSAEYREDGGTAGIFSSYKDSHYVSAEDVDLNNISNIEYGAWLDIPQEDGRINLEASTSSYAFSNSDIDIKYQILSLKMSFIYPI